MKKNVAKLTIVLFTSILVAACGGDDSATSNNVNNTQNNRNNTNIQNNQNNQNNANNQNNQNNQNNANNQNNINNVSDMGPDMTLEEDMGTDMASDEDMGPGGEVPITWPATPGEFADSANANTFISELITPEIVGGEPACCKDFGDISKNQGTDNALAKLDNDIAGFGASLAGSLQSGIEQGSVLVVLDHRELSGADDPDGFVLSWLNGAFTNGTTYATAAAGQGQFLVTADSFEGGTGEPQIVFNPAQMILGEMSAGPASVSLLLPLNDAFLAVTVQNAEVDGIATLSQDGVEYTAGTISGYIAVDNLFDALNELAASSCGCLGLQQPMFTDDGNGYSGACVANASDLCPGFNDQICRVIGGTDVFGGEFCTVLPTLFESAADINTNGDPDTYEALSLGLEWIGVNAEVTGIAN